MANTIKIKSSTTAGNTPSLQAGELGVNIADAKLWVGNGSSNVLLNPTASTNADTLDSLNSTQFVRSDVADTVAGILTYSANSTGGTIMSRTGYSDFIGYNTNYGSYIAGGAGNAAKAIYASGYLYDGSAHRQLFHEGHAPTAAEVGALSTGGGTLTGTLNIGNTGDEKIVLKNSNNPYVMFQQGTTNKGFIQWNAAYAFLEIANSAESTNLRLDDTLQLSLDGGSYYDVLTSNTGLLKTGGDLTGDLTLWGSYGQNSSSALSAWTGVLRFDTDYSDTARGPNKVEIYNDGSAWVAGLGVHTDTVGFYSGNKFAWYKSNSQTGFVERMALDSSGNLTGAGTLGTNASRWSTIYGAAGDFSGNVKIISSSPTLNIANSSVNNFESGRIRFTEADMEGSPLFQGAFLHYDGDGNKFYIGTHNANDSNTANDIRSIQLARGTGNITLLKNTTVNTNLTVAGSCTFAALSGTTGTFSGAVTVGGNLTIPQGNHFKLDGGSDTYIYSDTSDSIAFNTYNVQNLIVRTAGVTLGGTVTFNGGFSWSASNSRLSLSASDYQLQFLSGSHNWYAKLNSSGTFAIHKNGVGDYLTVSSAGTVTVSNNLTVAGSCTFAALSGTTANFSGDLTVGGYARSKNISYAADQDVAYLIAGTSGWTGATTNWNTYGFQHRIKTNSGGVPRVTIDRAGGEAFSVDNSSNAVIGNNLTVGGSIYLTHSDTNTRLHEGSGNSLRITTNSGYVDIGPMNSSYSHFQTDRGKFYFNKEIEISGRVIPYTNNTYTLGTNGYRWSTIYGSAGDFSGNLTVSGSCTFAALSGTTGTFSGDLTASGITNVVDFRIGNTRTNSHSSTNAAWYNIAGWGSTSGTRGGKIFVLSYTGGSFTPVTYVIKAFKNWSGTVSLILEKHGNSNYITKVRIAHDGSASPGPVYKLQVYLVGNSSGHSFRLYEYNAIGYNGGLASETMTAVSGSWTTATERDFPTSQGGISTILGGTINGEANLALTGADHTLYSGEADNELRFGRGSTECLRFYVQDYHSYIDYIQDADSNGDHYLHFRNQAGGTGARGFKFEGGPVGINTIPNAASYLHVNGWSIFESGGSLASIRLKSSAGEWDIDNNNGTFGLQWAGGDKLTLSNSGNLTVSGEATFAALNTYWTNSTVRFKSDSNFNFLRGSDGGAQAARFKGIQVSDTYNGTPPTNGILFGTDTQLYRSAANTLSLGSDDSLAVPQYLSVNTSGKYQTLTVNGNIWLPGSTGQITWSNGDVRIKSHSGYHMSLDTYDGSSAAVENLRLKSGGNVGVNAISDPSASLHVGGSAIVGRTNDQGSYPNDDYDLFVGNGNSGTRILLYNDSGNYHSALINYDTNCLKLGLNNSNSADSLLTTTAVNITSTGVGVGCTPTQKLDVNGQSRLAGKVTAVTSEVAITSGGGYTTHLNYNNTGSHYISTGNSGFTLFRGSSNGVNAMKVNGDGKVSINSSSNNGYNLYVTGTSYFNSGSTLTPATLYTSQSTGGNYLLFNNASGQLGYLGWGSTGNNDLYIVNQGGSNTGAIRLYAGGNTRVLVDSDGDTDIYSRLGVGGAHSGSYGLYVHGTSYFGSTGTFQNNGSNINIKNTWSSGNHDINFIGGSSSGGSANNTAARIRVLATAPGGAATGSMQFTVNSGDSFVDAMHIAANGNVSIGTTSSAYGRLFVDAATNAAACALAVRGRDSSASYIALNVLNNADGELFSILNNGRAKFTGLVGINRTPDGYGDTKLEVNGNVSGTRFLSGGTITNGTHAFEAYGSSFESSSIRLKEQGSGENEDPGILFQKGNAASTGDHCGGIYFQGTSSLNYAIIRGTCAGSSRGQLNIHIAGQQNTITRTSNDTPIFQLGELGLALGATPNDSYKLYVNGAARVTGTTTIEDYLWLKGGLRDDGGDHGTNGQVLSTDGSGAVHWVNQSSGSGSGTVSSSTTTSSTTDGEVAIYTASTTVKQAAKLYYNGSDDSLTVGQTSSSGVAQFNVIGDGYFSTRIGVGSSPNSSYTAFFGGNIYCNGDIGGYSKSFRIPHPTKEGMNLRHSSLEGPEIGVYQRGEIQGDTIELPDYWAGLVRDGTVTVQLTPKGSFQQLYVVSASNTEVRIAEANGADIDCYYTIYGERADVDRYDVEYEGQV